jgi:hypothetical protein
LKGLTLEHRRVCNFFFEECGVWYCSKYQGGADEVPRLISTDLATETEARERNEAKRRWHQERPRYATNIGGFRPVGGGDGSSAFPVSPGTVAPPRMPFGTGPGLHHESHAMSAPHNAWDPPSSPGGFIVPGSFPSPNYYMGPWHASAPSMPMPNTLASSPRVEFPSPTYLSFPDHRKIMDRVNNTGVGGNVTTNSGWNMSLNVSGNGNTAFCDSNAQGLTDRYYAGWPRSG